MPIAADLLGADVAPAVGAALVTAGIAVLLAVLRAVGLVITGKRERRRALYSEAYRSAMAWRELLYRVRRRAYGAEAERELIDAFHDLQEKLDYYEGWTASESLWMGRSYCRLVSEIKDSTRAPIRAAWEEADRRKPSEGTRDDDVLPDVTATRDSYLKDVRDHLSLNPLWKIAVVWRNRVWFRKGQR